MAVDFISEYARAQPDQPALIDADRVLTWRQYEERRNRVGLGLLALGVRRPTPSRSTSSTRRTTSSC